MRILSLLFGILIFAFAVADAATYEPRRISKDEMTPAVWGVIELPRTPGPHPAVIILPGSSGWRPDYAKVAEEFADSGFVALALDYYAETGRDTSRSDKIQKLPVWQSTIRNAVICLRQSASVSGIGLVGYSRGAFLAVSVASSIPELSAVVDFIGGGGVWGREIDDEVLHFPPLIIFHGEADSVVPVRFAYQLRDAVASHGGEVEVHIYPGAEHGFNAPWIAAYSDSLTADTWKHTVDFLRRRLGS
jgi:carboxymethylenebutenolidase